MKAIVCELCGSNELVKSDGLFECVHCGTKYTPEEARGLLTEITGTVSIDRSGELDNILQNADATFADGNYAAAYSLYSKALDIQFDEPKAILFRSISEACRQGSEGFNPAELGNSAVRAIEVGYSQAPEGYGYATMCQIGCREIAGIISKYSRAWRDELNAKCVEIDRNMEREIARSKSSREEKNLRRQASEDKRVLNIDYSKSMNALVEMSKAVACAVLERVPNPETANDGYWKAVRALLNAIKPHADDAKLAELYKKYDEQYADWRPAYIAAKGIADDYNAAEQKLKDVESEIASKQAELSKLGLFKGAEKRDINMRLNELEEQKLKLYKNLLAMLE